MISGQEEICNESGAEATGKFQLRSLRHVMIRINENQRKVKSLRSVADQV